VREGGQNREKRRAISKFRKEKKIANTIQIERKIVLKNKKQKTKTKQNQNEKKK
jgi:hypothetical protein